MKEIKIIKAGVIGDPISHSLSPKIHGYFLKQHNINGQYEAIKVAKEDLQESVKKIADEGFAGFNVTIPHKEEIFKICNHKSKSASLTRAVNTVIITKDGKFFGHNSDVDGFLNNLKDQAKDFTLKGKSAFIIGAGGAARAVVYGLVKSGVKEVFISNRNANRAENLISDFADFSQSANCKITYLEKRDFEKNLDKCDLLVNSTSLGMVNQSKLELDISAIKKSAIIYDIVYNPLMTDLLKEGQANGNKIVTGLGMLVWQALVGFEAWFGKKVEIDEEIFQIIS